MQGVFGIRNGDRKGSKITLLNGYQTMPKYLKTLSEKEVEKIEKSGKNGTFSLGGVPGFSLRTRLGMQATYILRYSKGDKRCNFTIEKRKELSLKEAREIALSTRANLLKGIDPLDERKQKSKKQCKKIKKVLSFEELSTKFLLEREKNGYWKHNSKNGYLQAYRMLENHALKKIGYMDINKITPQTIWEIAVPMWSTKTDTARKLISLLRQIFNWAIAFKLRRNPENPADIKSALGVLLEPLKHSGKIKQNHAAPHFSSVPELVFEIHTLISSSAKAVEFSILTATRSAAVRNATWKEIDLEKGTWIIPLEHDKSKILNRDRTIFLNEPAKNLLRSLYRYPETDLVFPGYRFSALSDMSLLMVLRRLHKIKKEKDGIGWIDPEKTKIQKSDAIITVHGTARATFKTWAKDDELGNNRKFDQEAVELCLLHSRNDQYQGAYDRTKLEKERRLIMEAWGAFCYSRIKRM